MRKPRPLKSGDRIAVVAPGSPFARDEFDRGVAELRRLGFEPTWEESVFASESAPARMTTSTASSACLRCIAGDLVEPRLLGLALLLPLALELLLQLAAGLAVGIEKKRNPVDRPVAHSNTARTPCFCFAAVVLTKCSCGPQPVGVLL